MTNITHVNIPQKDGSVISKAIADLSEAELYFYKKTSKLVKHRDTKLYAEQLNLLFKG